MARQLGLSRGGVLEILIRERAQQAGVAPGNARDGPSAETPSASEGGRSRLASASQGLNLSGSSLVRVYDHTPTAPTLVDPLLAESSVA
jgi:hypothetical protein